MEASLHPQSNHGIMDEEEDELGSMSSFSNDDDDDDDEVGEGSSNSVGSSSSDFTEDASSNSSMEGPLFEMTSLLSQLPFKRGLSKHFDGKSQSFTSLSNVKCLEDLVKPERPLLLMRRKHQHQLKSSKSYGWGLDNTHKALSPKGCSRAITKKSSRGSFSSSLGMRRASSFLGSRPPSHCTMWTSGH